MSTNSQIDKHMFYTLNSLLSQQNNGVFDISYIREKFNNSIIVDTHRKSLYALNHEFGYVSLYVNPDDQNSYSDISAYSTLTYNIFPYTDASGNSYLLKVQFENGLFSLEATPGFYFDINHYTVSSYLKNTKDEIIIECNTNSKLTAAYFDKNNLISSPYNTYVYTNDDITYNYLNNFDQPYVNFGNNVQLSSSTEKDDVLTINMIDKYGVSCSKSVTVKYRKIYKLYRSGIYSTSTWRDWQTVRKDLATAQDSFLTNNKLGNIYKESNSIYLNNYIGQHILINTPIDKGEIFTGVLGGGSIIEFVKIKDFWYMSTGTNFGGHTLTLDI